MNANWIPIRGRLRIDLDEEPVKPSNDWSGGLGLNSSNCAGSGNWYCATDSTAYITLNGRSFTWTFVLGTGNFTALDSAQFNVCATSAGCDGNLFSQSGTPTSQIQTPEPASLALLSAGLIGLGGLFRRRKQ